MSCTQHYSEIIFINYKKHTRLGISVVGIDMTTCRNESVSGIVGAGKGIVREHITVKVVAYRISVERDQTVVGVILEAAVWSRGLCYLLHRS